MLKMRHGTRHRFQEIPMLKLLLVWLLNALCLLGVAYLLPGVHVVDFKSALLAAAVLGVINTFIRPVLMLLTLPITLLTLGLFSIVLNALMFALAAYFLSGFNVDGFWSAFLGAILFGVLSWAANTLLLRDSP
jgi:putative membrane protein